MKKFKISTIALITLILVFSCKDQLDVKNPNQPTAGSINTENNITALGLGVYASGFRGLKYGGFQGTFATDVMSFHEIMGDVIGVEAANLYINQLGMPDWVKLDNNSTVNNPSTPNTQLALIRLTNQNSYADQNPIYYEWAYMYALNNACNGILANVDIITDYKGDVATKKNALKAWAYWWKGYAYSRIGSMYYAGVINNDVGKIVNNYVSHDGIIAESNANFDNAIAALNAITATGVVADYNTILKAMIPSFFQVGVGQAPSIAQFIRNINTMKARNLLINKRFSAMTAGDWNNILTLTNSGIQSTDNIFKALSNATSDFMSASGGCVALIAASDPSTGTYKISERLMSDFLYRPGDKRYTNNFSNSVTGGKWLGNSDRGNIFNTRYKLLNNTTGVGPAGAGVIVLANKTAGSGEFFIAGTYEENELMKAEAKANTGDLAGATASVQNVINFQGGGVTVTTFPDLATANKEIRIERRVGLAFKGLAFYDARRYGYLDPVSSGGGRSGVTVVDKTGLVNTNAQINFNYLDYWDVCDNEIVFNTPSGTSAPTKNPRVN
ncbi:MAG TPA: hypothetical protein PLR06_01720 [Cyclobacteriaceae bacterium]|nr:hypothetical protein [Cyclobacteriaceae bacterium]